MIIVKQADFDRASTDNESLSRYAILELNFRKVLLKIYLDL